MKQRATQGRTATCTRCGGVAPLFANGRGPSSSSTFADIYGCPACGFCFSSDGKQYADNLKELKDFFRGATQGQAALTKGLAGQNLPPAIMALLQAQIIDYGMTMWFDGLKQGLMLGALDKEYQSGEVRNGPEHATETTPG